MAFLRQHHPFSELDDADVAAVAQSLRIVHIAAGDTPLTQDGPPAAALGVIRKGALQLLAGDVVVDQLEAGDLYGMTSAMTARPPTMTVRAVEDTLAYLVPASVARRVFASERAIDSVWATARQRVRATDAVARTVRGADPRFARIGPLVSRPPVTIEPDASVAEAAVRMRDERVSSLVIEVDDDRAIVTDRDLRARVVADRGSFDRPVLDIATRPVRVATADTPADEALLEMLAHGVHHLPILDGGRLIGIVTDTDLMRPEDAGPFAIRNAIERARSPEEVVAAGRRYPAIAAGMVEAGTDPVTIGRVISIIADAATRRLVQLAIDDLGEPPCSFAWIALGSAARHEQAMDSAQAHALAFGPGFDPAQHDDFGARLAERVTSGLETIGFARGHGDALAVHPAMRRSLTDWGERFRTWIPQPDADTLILSSIGFDVRQVAGGLDAEGTLDAAVADARTNPEFLHLLARVALREEPPSGFIRGLVVASNGEHADTLDIEHGGIIIVTAIARARAIAAGATTKDTLTRLEAAVAGGTLSSGSGAELSDAFRFLLDLRLRHQTAQVRAGKRPDDLIEPAELGAIERSGLRETFRSIRDAQLLLGIELGVR